MRATEILSSDKPIRQGDLFQWARKGGLPFDSEFALVLTADCDIAQQKHYNQLLLCPVVPVRRYIEVLWVQKKAARLRQQVFKKTSDILERITSNAFGTPVPPSDSTTNVLLTSPEKMNLALTHLKAADSVDGNSLLKLSNAFSSLNSLDVTLPALTESTAAFRNCDKAKAAKDLDKEARDELSNNEPSDVVAIPDDASGPNAASVILLRFPYSCAFGRLCTSQAEMVDRDADAYRIGRLRPELKYYVSQKFGYLFSRIGLSGEYEQDRETAIDLAETGI